MAEQTIPTRPEFDALDGRPPCATDGCAGRGDVTVQGRHLCGRCAQLALLTPEELAAFGRPCWEGAR